MYAQEYWDTQYAENMKKTMEDVHPSENMCMYTCTS